MESGQLESVIAEEYVSGHVCAVAGSAVNIAQIERNKGPIMIGSCPAPAAAAAAVVVSAVVHDVPIGR